MLITSACFSSQPPPPPPSARSFIVGVSVWGRYDRKQVTTELHCYNLHLSHSSVFVCVVSLRMH